MTSQPSNQGQQDPRKGRNFAQGFSSLMDAMPNAGIVRFFMFLAQVIISPFAIVVETFTRKNMGERFFTLINWFIGMWIVAMFGLADVFSTGGGILWLFSWVYWMLGIYHLIDQWRKSRMGDAAHSLSEGQSRLEPLAILFLSGINTLSEWVIRLSFSLFFRPSEEEKAELERLFPVFTDRHHFTLLIVEPLFLIILSFICVAFSMPLASLIMVSTGASMANGFITRQMRRHRLLNIRDGMIEADFMRRGLPKNYKKMQVSQTMRQTINGYAEQAVKDPIVMEQIQRTSPSIAEAMAALNPKLQEIGKA